MSKGKRKSANAKVQPGAGTRSIPAHLVPLVVLLSVGTLAYWNSFDAPLVFDDLLSIQRNEGVRFGTYFDINLLNGRALLYWTFAANYFFHGQAVWGYHLVNLILHLLNGVLIYFLASRVFMLLFEDSARSRSFATLAAGFFLVHPVQTESVTYISSRSELLSTFFYVAAVLIFVNTPWQKIGYLLSLVVAVMFVLGIASKETVITLPAVLFAYDFIFLSGASLRTTLSRWRFYLPFVAGAALVGYRLMTVTLVGSAGAALGHLPPWLYFLTQLKVIVRYIQIILLPVGLNLDYDFKVSLLLTEPSVLASLAVILATLGLAWYLRRTQPVFSFSIFWFFLTLAPTSSVVPILDTIFEHRLYLPMVGVCLSFPLVVDGLLRVVASRFRCPIRVVPASAVLLLVLTVGTILRNQVWRSEITLWADVISKSPDKARGYNVLAMAYFKRGEYQTALGVTQRGLRRVPNGRRDFLETMGNLYLRLNRYEEAAQAFRATTVDAIPVAASMGYNNLGVTYQYMWQQLQRRRDQISVNEFETEKVRVLTLARDAFIKSMEITDDHFTAQDSYVNVSFELGDADELRQDHAAQLKLGETFRSRYILGKLAFLADDFQTAAEQFDLALQVDAGQQLVWFNYGYALRRLGRTEESLEKYMQAIRVNPLFIEAHHNAAQLYMEQGSLVEAVDHFEEVLRMFPRHVSTHVHLARISMFKEDWDIARQHLGIVLADSPGHEEANRLWRELGL